MTLPSTRPSARTFAERLADGVMVGAEGYVFELERRGYVKAGPYVPEVILDAPDALRELHREFLRAGSDVMVALTYYAHREKLRDVGRADDLEMMNRQAVRIANEVAAEGGALVAGNICNTWCYDPANPEVSGDIVRAQYREQLGWAVEEGVDFVISETNDYLGEALIGLEVCHELGLPAMVTLASVQATETYDGYDYVEACRILADNGAAIVGLNCSRGPSTMLPLLERIRDAVDVPVAAQPVPYRTDATTPAFESLVADDGRRLFPIQLESFGHTRFEMADFARRAAQLGINYIGICCGGAPHHVRAMAEALGRQTPASRYSPAIELHPVLGIAQTAATQNTMGDWTAAS
jgi:betaine-homocysteine S-methyltransferase